MTFIIQNTINAFDPIHATPFASQTEAEDAARQLLEQTPTAVLRVAQVLKVLRASVTVTEEAPEASPELPGSE